jgi:hypothetical protein
MPRPPSVFGTQIFFHDARHKGFEGSEEIHVHQKVLIIVLMWAINVFKT